VPDIKNVDNAETPTGWQIMLLTRCNFRCRHCYLKRNGHLEKDNYWDISLNSHLREFFQKTEAIKALWMGGEPTIHPIFSTIINDITRHTLVKENWLVTNGWWLEEKYIDEYLKKFKQIHNLSLIVVSQSEFHNEFQSEEIKNKLKDPKALSDKLGIEVFTLMMGDQTYPISNYTDEVNSKRLDFRKLTEPFEDWRCVRNPASFKTVKTFKEAIFQLPFVYPDGSIHFCYSPDMRPIGNIKDDFDYLKKRFIEFNNFIYGMAGNTECYTCTQRVNATFKE